MLDVFPSIPCARNSKATHKEREVEASDLHHQLYTTSETIEIREWGIRGAATEEAGVKYQHVENCWKWLESYCLICGLWTHLGH